MIWSKGPLAVKHGHVGIVDLLLKNGADQNVQSKTLLLNAAKRGRTNILKRVIESSANTNVNDRDITLLMYASLRRDKEMMRLVTGAGANLELERLVGK